MYARRRYDFALSEIKWILSPTMTAKRLSDC